MYVYKIETSYIEDNFNGTSCQCCGNCQLWAPEQKIDYKINAADADITDTTVTATPLNLGACVISRRSGTDGETLNRFRGMAVPANSMEPTKSPALARFIFMF